MSEKLPDDLNLQGPSVVDLHAFKIRRAHVNKPASNNDLGRRDEQPDDTDRQDDVAGRDDEQQPALRREILKHRRTLPFIAWRDGRPRFSPGPRERALGFRGRDLRHKDGRWYSPLEAEEFALARQAEILATRRRMADAGVPIVAERPESPRTKGWVYFLRAGESVKIGFSSNPLSRGGALSTGLADGADGFCCVPGTHADERRAHRAMAQFRKNGEWFALAPAVAAFMARSLTFGRIMTGDPNDKSLSHAVVAQPRVARGCVDKPLQSPG